RSRRRGDRMKRREFITLLSGAAASCPLTAHAQGERVRRIGFLTGNAEDSLQARANLAALREGLAELGGGEGRNLRIHLRFTLGDPDRFRTYAMELVRLEPDVIVTTTRQATRAVQEHTQIIPIVFTAGGDPVTGGVLQNVARPEGNTTGFTNTVNSLGGKWM